MKRLFLLGVSIFFLSHFILAQTIEISTQQDLDALSKAIIDEYKNGARELTVNFAKNIYYFTDKQILINRQKIPDFSLVLNGNGATFIGAGADFTNETNRSILLPYYSTFATTNGYIDKNYNPIDLRTDMQPADSIVEILDVEKRQCRVKANIGFDIDDESCQNVYMLLTCWYLSKICKVNRIEGGYIYFIAPSLTKYSPTTVDYDINGDWYFARKKPRYMLYNVSETKPLIVKEHIKIPANSSIHESTASCFLRLNESSFQKIEMNGFNFLCNNGSNALFSVSSLDVQQFEISDCEFKNIHGAVLKFGNSSNVTVSDCRFIGCYEDGLFFDNKSANIIVKNNYFENHGLAYTNYFCIRCQGSNYLIEGNELHNFNRGGLVVGVHYSQAGQNLQPSFGIVQYNKLWYDDEYARNKEKYTLMDSGALHTCTINDGAVFRYNLVYNYTGIAANRSIFCDDGTKGVEIYGNIVIKTGNSYDIGLRLVPTVKDRVPDHNTNNFVSGNLLTGYYRFVGRDNIEGNCRKGANFYIQKDLVENKKTVIGNVQSISKDVIIPALLSYDENGFVLKRNAKSTIKKLDCYDHIKQWIRFE